jgi:hypothetical protein
VAGAAVVGAAPAQAATSFNMSCKILSSSIPWAGSVQATVTPAKPKAGGNASLTITFPSGYKTGPVPVPANKLQPVLTLSINGKTVTARGGTNPSALGPNVTFQVPSTKVQFKAKEGSNKVVLTKMVFDYLPGQPDTTCTGDKPTVISFTVAAATPTKTATPTPTPTQSTAQPTQSDTAEPAVTTTSSDNPSPPKQPNKLGDTGPEDATRTLLIALVTLQVGLIVWFRWGRRPSYAGSHRGGRR